MANKNTNNIGDCGCTNKKTTMVDPNKFYDSNTTSDYKNINLNNFSVPLEDLSVMVELTTTRKNRTVLTIGGKDGSMSESTVGGAGVINFIDGTNINGKKSLTTAYTDLKVISETDNVETLGITNIDIEFNSSYAPLITINFVDVRGNAIFSQGTKSKYNVFFELPYPIFNLTIKGFYGTPVKYCLHLTKFNSKFNSETGNFEITANFVGYTYAILSDMLMGYLKAITNTDIGRKKFEEYKQLDPTLITLNELTTKIGDVDRYIVALKNNDINVKELADIDRALSSLSDIRSFLDITTASFYIQDNKNGGPIIFLTTNAPTDKKNKNIAFKNAYITNVKDRITKLNESLNTVSKLSEESFTDVSIYSNISKNYLNSIVTKEQLISSEISKTKTDNSESNADKVRQLKEKLINGLQNLGDGDYIVYDFTTPYSIISETKTKLETAKVELNKRIGQKATSNIADIIGNKGLPLDPTIRNIVKIFTVHVEILLYCIWQVAANTKGNTQRTAEIKKLIDRNKKSIDGNKNLEPTNGENGTIPLEIYPWPEFRKVKTDGQGLEEAYIGSEDGITFNVDEVKFIEDLLRGMLEASKNDQDSTKTIDGNEKLGWYPVSPLDTSLFLDKNPYEFVSNSLTDNIIRLVGFRAMTYLGLTNRVVNTSDVKVMAIMEARNAFNSIKNTKIKEDISILDKNSFLDKLIKPNGKILMNNLYSQVFLPINGDYQFYYIIDSNNEPISSASFLDNRAYIPVYGDDKTVLNGNIFYEEPKNRKMLSYSDVTAMTKNSAYYLSNYNSDIVNNASDVKLNDGGIYIKIFEQNEFNSKVKELPVIEESLIKLLSPSELTQSILSNRDYTNLAIDNKQDGLNNFNIGNQLGVNYGIQTYSTLKYNENGGSGNNPDPLWLLFYSNNYNYNINELNGVILSRAKYRESTNETLVFEDTYNTQAITSVGNKSATVYFVSENVDKLIDDYYGTQKPNNRYNLNFATTDASYPKIMFNVLVNNVSFNISLFGSKLYNKQTTKEAKAFLFLHTISWNGLVKNKTGVLNTNEIRNLFTECGSFINAPKLWVAFVGGLIWRYKHDINNDPIKFYDSSAQPGDKSYIDGLRSNTYNYPLVTQYLTTNSSDFPMSFGKDNVDQYIYIEDVLVNLPEQAKEEFINQFLDFANGSSFSNLMNELELTDLSGDIYTNWDTMWDDVISHIYEKKGQDLYNLNTVRKIKPFADRSDDLQCLDITYMKSKFKNFKNYITFSPISNYDSLILDTETDFKYNFQLEIWDDAPVMKNTLLPMFTSTVVITNMTHKIWSEPKPGIGREPIKVRQSIMELYITSFITEFNKLQAVAISPEKDKEIKQNTFGVMDNDVIRLNLYRTIKSIYDKWIGGAIDGNNIIFQCGHNEINSGRNSTDSQYAEIRTGKPVQPQLIDSFRFVTRSFREVGDKFYINPLIFKELLLNNWNQSFADVLSRLLTANNFEFVPLPSFIDYSDPNSLVKVFKPYPYNEAVNVETCGPSFVCVYIGQTSNKLDLNNSEYGNDGFDFNCSDESAEFSVGIPDDFSPAADNSNKYPETVSVFAVNYGQQNQNIFRNIMLDQQEFTETAESLQITDDIAKRGSQTNQTLVGQNLFNVYQVRSYKAEVEMMGNAMIQPMMYFQLNNIPMFHGAYLITRVKHSIRPNYMTTTFSGIRVRAIETPLLDSATLYMSILGSIKSDNDSSNGTELASLTGINEIPDPSVTALNFVNPYKGYANISRGLIGGEENHQGIDFQIPVNTDLVAITDGYIELLKYNETGYGIYIVINHGVLGDKKQVYKSVYGHISDLEPSIFKGILDLNNMSTSDITKVTNGINLNIKINKGTVFAKSGGKQGLKYLDAVNKKHDVAGTVSTGAHLHFELHIGAEKELSANFKSKGLPYVNPLPYIPAGLDPKYKQWNPDKPNSDNGDIAYIPLPSNNDRLKSLGKL